jgi:hypothetical protein
VARALWPVGRVSLVVALAASALGVSASAANAAIYAVDRTDDSATASACTAAANDCSLRGAIAAASAASGNVVSLASNQIYTLSAGSADSAPGSLVPAGGDLDITTNMTIEGNNSTIDGGARDRIFQIEATGSNAIGVTINNLTMRNGQPTGALGHGGAIFSRGANLTLNRCEIRDCTAGSNNGGAISANNVASVASAISVSLQKTTLAGNSAANGGGLLLSGVAGSLSQSTLSGNSASSARGGGGIYLQGNSASVALSNCTLTLNSASYAGASGVAAAVGGGIFADDISSASSSLQSTILAANTSGASGSTVDYGGNIPASTSAYNLVGVFSGTFGVTTNSKFGTSGAPLNPRLDALAAPVSSGPGPRVHYASLTGPSPAIDAGIATGISTDATNAPRIVDQPGITNVADGSDIGAAETQLPNNSPVPTAQTVNLTQNQAITITLTATDANNDTLRYKITSLPANGALRDGSNTAGHLILAAELPYTLTQGNQVTYVPNLNFSGSNSFNFRVNDGRADSATTATVTLVVAGNPTPSSVDVQASGAVTVTRYGQVRQRTGRYTQSVVLQNVSGAAITGPLILTVDGLAATATLYNSDGTTTTAPISPYKTIALTGNTFSAGSSLVVSLEFTASATPITYNTRVLKGGPF